MHGVGPVMAEQVGACHVSSGGSNINLIKQGPHYQALA